MSRLIEPRFWIGILLTMGLPVSATARQVRFVDDDAPLGGDGQGWSSAYTYLQDALSEAAANPTITEIRIAAGIYKPDHDEAGNVSPGQREDLSH